MWRCGEIRLTESFTAEQLQLYIDPDGNLYIKYQNPSSSGFQDIVSTMFLYCYTGRVEKEASVSQYFTEFAQKLIR